MVARVQSIRGLVHHYTYNNPTNFVDLFGLSPFGMLGSGEQPDVPDRQFGGRGTDEEYEEAKRRRTMNGFIGQAASAGGSPNDDVHYNSETGETQVVTTDDDHDNLFVDGKFIGISGQGAWKHYASDAAIYDSYSADFYRDAYGLNLNDKIYMRGYLTTRMATRA